MTLYRKKPIPVSATQWFKLGDEPTGSKVEQLCGFISANAGPIAGPTITHKLHTIEGRQELIPSNWIVGPGHRGEYWIVQHDIFKATYEEIT